MNPPILDFDLTKQAPHSPRERIAGFRNNIRDELSGNDGAGSSFA
jgi:hypothetical protein